AEPPHELRARRRVVRADHVVSGLDELRDETTTDRTARSGNENTHDCSPLVCWSLTRATSGSGGRGQRLRRGSGGAGAHAMDRRKKLGAVDLLVEARSEGPPPK